MATLMVSETCPNCLFHEGAVPLNCFDEATVMVMGILATFSEVHEVTSLMRKWLDQEGKETAVLQFFTVEGKSMLFVYTTTDQFNAEDELKIDIPDDASELFNN